MIIVANLVSFFFLSWCNECMDAVAPTVLKKNYWLIIDILNNYFCRATENIGIYDHLYRISSLKVNKKKTSNYYLDS